MAPLLFRIMTVYAFSYEECRSLNLISRSRNNLSRLWYIKAAVLSQQEVIYNCTCLGLIQKERNYLITMVKAPTKLIFFSIFGSLL